MSFIISSREHLSHATRPMLGETECGDQVGSWLDPGGTLHLVLADGLGHGRLARQAATAALGQLLGATHVPMEESFAQCDRALLGSRGVAVAYLRVQTRSGHLLHAAVGNVRTLVFHQNRVKRLSGCRGIVGAGFTNLRPESCALTPGDWVVLFSDGLRENSAIGELLHGALQPSEALAQRMLARWARDEDDAAILLYHYAQF